MVLKVSPDLHQCHHHHQNRNSFLDPARPASVSLPKDGTPTITVTDQQLNTVAKTIIPATTTIPSSVLTPSSPELDFERPKRTTTQLPQEHKFVSPLQRLAFLAVLINLLSSIVYFPSATLSLPPIVDHVTPRTVRYGNWLLQIIASCGFFTSSLLLAVETQTRWWVPAPRVAGWWISSLNLGGGLGFLVSGTLGFVSFPKTGGTMVLGCYWANFLGCWAFMVAAVLQWFEAVDKCPVVEVKGKSGEEVRGI